MARRYDCTVDAPRTRRIWHFEAEALCEALDEAGAWQIERADGRWENGQWADFNPVDAPHLIGGRDPEAGAGRAQQTGQNVHLGSAPEEASERERKVDVCGGASGSQASGECRNGPGRDWGRPGFRFGGAAARFGPARVVMEILGHSQISVTLNIYAHVAPEIARAAANRMDSALWDERDEA